MRILPGCALGIALILPGVLSSQPAPADPTGPVAASSEFGAIESPDEARPAAPNRVIRTGAEVLLRDSVHLVAGRRVGLITNPTALTHEGRHTIDLLDSHPDVWLATLFAPEHGLRGGVDAGVHIESGIDPVSRLPVRSLYGETVQPTRHMLRDIDVLVFDMLDISARTYTYIWTMTLAMEAAAEAGIPFIVLDRPNPLTGRPGGPLPTLEALRTGPAITGHYPVPFRHGMTPGEIARYVNSEFDVGADLRVIPLDGWTRDLWYDQTGLPWVDPSPNIRSLEAALNFSGLGSLEATALSLGRGTPEPFSVIGAPWLDVRALLPRLARHQAPGVEFRATRFTPNGEGWMQFRGRTVPGVELVILDREQYDPSLTALVLLTEIHRLHPRQLGMKSMKHVMDDWTAEEIRRGVEPREIAARWERAIAGWEQRTGNYRLYE